MSKAAIRLQAIAGAEYVMSEQMVIFTTGSDTPPVELPLHLLPRLIGLSLHLAGRISQSEEGFSTALMLDSWQVTTTPDAVLMRVDLPGGAPLTFALPPERARLLGLALIEPAAGDSLQ